MDRYTYVSAAPLKRPPGRGGKAIQSHLLHLCDELVHTTAVTPKTIVECATSLRQKICPMVSKWFQSGFKVVSWWFHGGFKVVSRGPPQRGLGREGAAGGRGGPDRRSGAWGGGAGRRKGAWEEDISSSFPLLVTIASGGLKPPMKPP